MGKKRKASSPLQSTSPPGTSGAAAPGQDGDRKELKELRQEITSLRQRICYLERQQDWMQQQNRITCLIFSGSALPEYVDGEKTAEVIQNMTQALLGITVESSEIKAAFRLRNSKILVEFSSAAFNSARSKIFR